MSESLWPPSCVSVPARLGGSSIYAARPSLSFWRFWPWQYRLILAAPPFPPKISSLASVMRVSYFWPLLSVTTRGVTKLPSMFWYISACCSFYICTIVSCRRSLCLRSEKNRFERLLGSPVIGFIEIAFLSLFRWPLLSFYSRLSIDYC